MRVSNISCLRHVLNRKITIKITRDERLKIYRELLSAVS